MLRFRHIFVKSSPPLGSKKTLLINSIQSTTIMGPRRVVARPVARPVAGVGVGVGVGRPVPVRRMVVASSAIRASNSNAATVNNTYNTSSSNTNNNATGSSSNAVSTGSATAVAVVAGTRMMQPMKARESMLTSSSYTREIYDLAVEEKWEELKTKLDIRKDGAKFVDMDQTERLALHVCCANPNAPLDVVRKLLEYHPKAASMFDKNGDLPLFLCIQTQGIQYDVTLAVLKAYPYAAVVVREGNNNTNDNDQAPIAMLYLKFLQPDISENKSKVTAITSAEELVKDDKVLNMYKIATALILAAGGSYDAKDTLDFDENSFEFLKTVLGHALHNDDPSTPPDLIELTSRLFVQAVSNERVRRLNAAKKREEEAAVLGLAVKHPKNESNLLLDAVNAGIGWSWGVQQVYESDDLYDFAEIKTVGLTRLAPFASAAVGVRTDLDTVYCLLKRHPACIAEYIPNNYVLQIEKKAQNQNPRAKKGGSSGPCKCVIM